MTSRSVHPGPAIAALLIICASPVAASYAGDRPLQMVFTESLRGNAQFTLGDGGYSGTLNPGDGYVTSFTRDLPQSATVLFERVYVYWTWSRIDQAASYPTMEARLGDAGGPVLEQAARYADSKGFASKNDYFSGMDSYLPIGPHGDRVTVMVSNTADDGSTFIVQGAALFTVYKDESAPESAIWVAEGADLLYRSYGIPPELATTRVDFPGRIDLPRVKSARLLLVAPSAGFAREEIPEMNQILLNTPGSGTLPPLVEPVLRVLFPHYRGKTWTDVFSADESRQIGIASREIRPFLRYSDNFIEVRDNGDYFQLCNAVLRVEYGEEK
ncbi:MAG TPA: DUF3344 domain-containing protein [Methanolinea sp.]|nr:DUF3344 domain-containing protein [Methanolinea sp.]HQK56419.1 DUF3344 domain-containing protein [Methanolinea sp.]